MKRPTAHLLRSRKRPLNTDDYFPLFRSQQSANLIKCGSSGSCTAYQNAVNKRCIDGSSTKKMLIGCSLRYFTFPSRKSFEI